MQLKVIMVLSLGCISQLLLAQLVGIRVSIESTLHLARHLILVRVCHHHLRFSILQTTSSLEIRKIFISFLLFLCFIVHREFMLEGGPDLQRYLKC